MGMWNIIRPAKLLARRINELRNLTHETVAHGLVPRVGVMSSQIAVGGPSAP